jgi:hypothetical protein
VWAVVCVGCSCFQAVVLADKPVISDDTNVIDPHLLDVLLANISTLASVFHKPPEAFVSRVRVAHEGALSCVSLLHVSPSPLLPLPSPTPSTHTRECGARGAVARVASMRARASLRR